MTIKRRNAYDECTYVARHTCRKVTPKASSEVVPKFSNNCRSIVSEPNFGPNSANSDRVRPALNPDAAARPNQGATSKSRGAGSRATAQRHCTCTLCCSSRDAYFAGTPTPLEVCVRAPRATMMSMPSRGRSPRDHVQSARAFRWQGRFGGSEPQDLMVFVASVKRPNFREQWWVTIGTAAGEVSESRRPKDTQ